MTPNARRADMIEKQRRKSCKKALEVFNFSLGWLAFSSVFFSIKIDPAEKPTRPRLGAFMARTFKCRPRLFRRSW